MRRTILAIAIFALLSSSALATDFSQPLTNLDGKPVVGGDGKPLEPQPTLGAICESALLAQYSDERDPTTGKETITAEEKFARWKLASKISTGDKNLTLSVEELALVKRLIGKGYAPLVVGQAWLMLDPGMK